jgi:2-polyprenyl-3-methyl-5-hydroxy-6-metoxy-1,4-benzoquinol methylase
MAAGFDSARFGGPIGRLLLEDQERVLFQSLGDVKHVHILDLGTGTGRAAIALARRGAIVTGVDASSEMLSVARRRASEEGLSIEFAEGDAHMLVFPDRAFDATVCFRLLMHVPDWRRALRELCRVSGTRVVFDYPSATSSAALQAIWRRAAAALGSNVEAYRVFTRGEIARELVRNGFRIVASHRQFVLPIALHKRLGSARLTRTIEGALSGVGLLWLAGSPVTVAAERCAS